MTVKPFESWIECTLSELIAAFEVREILLGNDPWRVVDLTASDNDIYVEFALEAERLLGHGSPVTVCEFDALDALYWLSVIVRCGGKEPTWGIAAGGVRPLESPIAPEEAVRLAWELVDPAVGLLDCQDDA